MCQNPENFRKLFIKEFKYWKLALHNNQCYLGRCVVILKRHAEDMFEISNEERDELFEIVKKLKGALSETFQPDLMNYSSLGNEVRHLHLHVIPRYNKNVEFAGITFMDKRWGQNPSPYDKGFTVPENVYERLVEKISSKLR